MVNSRVTIGSTIGSTAPPPPRNTTAGPMGWDWNDGSINWFTRKERKAGEVLYVNTSMGGNLATHNAPGQDLRADTLPEGTAVTYTGNRSPQPITANDGKQYYYIEVQTPTGERVWVAENYIGDANAPAAAPPPSRIASPQVTSSLAVDPRAEVPTQMPRPPASDDNLLRNVAIAAGAGGIAGGGLLAAYRKYRRDDDPNQGGGGGTPVTTPFPVTTPYDAPEMSPGYTPVPNITPAPVTSPALPPVPRPGIGLAPGGYTPVPTFTPAPLATPGIGFNPGNYGQAPLFHQGATFNPWSTRQQLGIPESTTYGFAPAPVAPSTNPEFTPVTPHNPWQFPNIGLAPDGGMPRLGPWQWASLMGAGAAALAVPFVAGGPSIAGGQNAPRGGGMVSGGPLNLLYAGV